MPELEDDSDTNHRRRLSNAALIERAAKALNPQLLAEGSWVADVGAAVEAADGRVFTGACIGGHLSICAELGALSQLVAAATPTVSRVVAVWRDPADAVLHVIAPCGRCREVIKSLSQHNLETIVILGPEHTATLRDLLPYAGWYAEPVHSQPPAL